MPVSTFSSIGEVYPSKINKHDRFGEMLVLRSEGGENALYELKVTSRIIDEKYERFNDKKEIEGYLCFSK